MNSLWYNPYDFWKSHLDEEKYFLVRKGLELYKSLRKQNLFYEDFIKFLLRDDTSFLTFEMINSSQPIEFVLQNQDSVLNWENVGLFTASIFETRFLAWKISSHIKLELLQVTHQPEYYFRYLNPNILSSILDKPNFKICH